MRKGLIENSFEHRRMTSLSDTLTVGLVLVLLFGSIALYLYTRVQQAEQKISLLESILLDLKMSAEIKSYSELPAVNQSSVNQSSVNQLSGGDYTLYEEDDNNTEDIDTTNTANNDAISVSSAGSVSSASSISSASSHSTESNKNTDIDTANSNTPVEKVSKMAVNYESMTLKELQTLAKTRGITGANSMKKGSIIEALKTSDRPPLAPFSSSLTHDPIHTMGAPNSSFIENSDII